jgi:hypothetical protein
MFDRDLNLEEKSVRGSLVTGLSEKDVQLLDIFEGDVSNVVRFEMSPQGNPCSQQYTREVVSVHPLSTLINIRDIPPIEAKSLVPTTPPPIPALASLTNTVEVETYVWCLSPSKLRATLWTFEEFVKHSAWKWIGASAANNKDYDEVDRRKAMEGVIVQAKGCEDSDD